MCAERGLRRGGGSKGALTVAWFALALACVALVLAAWAASMQREHRRQMEVLGDLIRQAADSGRPIMDIGPPGGGWPKLDRGD